MLETEEINQLLNADMDFSADKESLPEEEKQIISKIFKEPVEAMGKAIGKVISEECEISIGNIDIAKGSLIKETLDEENYFLKDINVKDASNSIMTIAADTQTARNVAEIVLEEIGSEGPLSNDEKSVWVETVEQMAVQFANGVSKQIDKKFEVSVDKEAATNIEKEENIIQISILLKANDKIDTTIYYLIPNQLLSKIVDIIKQNIKVNEDVSEKQEKEPEKEIEEGSATVQPIVFEEFTNVLAANSKENIDLLMDLQLQVSVELGKVKKPIKDILQFTEGTIVELERLAGENVDVLVSGKVIAKGEVVVVDQNFGVRITQIVTPDKRV